MKADQIKILEDMVLEEEAVIYRCLCHSGALRSLPKSRSRVEALKAALDLGKSIKISDDYTIIKV